MVIGLGRWVALSVRLGRIVVVVSPIAIAGGVLLVPTSIFSHRHGERREAVKVENTTNDDLTLTQRQRVSRK